MLKGVVRSGLAVFIALRASDTQEKDKSACKKLNKHP
jgi:D-Tyr-tRNAtyr deacylase